MTAKPPAAASSPSPCTTATSTASRASPASSPSSSSSSKTANRSASRSRSPTCSRAMDGRCRFLQPRHRCGAYEARPTACRLYPHFVVYWNLETARPVYADPPPLADAAAAGPVVPLLLGHEQCPGFTGAPLTDDDWLALLEETDHLQRNLA
ncbi:YkgJ family cysteine cluster protein [Tepidiforma flava]|uniref:YkgJ family cysteine cluster protein n=1 Tax=Tepidiforma flava TaxID=3004094 RepID=A0ABY7M6L7_9CHLR|nr:YkgJ family cysteine cluster protein [Tepidiforma flava]WBL35268.1 YkgJ family cysteine cluster protein [Tepidiforma flava]